MAIIKITKVLYSEQQIRQRVHEVAEEIKRDCGERNIRDIHLVALMQGAMYFVSDLARELSPQVNVLHNGLYLSSYENDTVSSGNIRVRANTCDPLEGKHVLMVDDILDTGNTFDYALNMIRRWQPASIKTCAFLDKPARRITNMRLDFRGYEIENEFVIGYGLDYRQYGRNLPYVGVMVAEKTEVPGVTEIIEAWREGATQANSIKVV